MEREIYTYIYSSYLARATRYYIIRVHARILRRLEKRSIDYRTLRYAFGEQKRRFRLKRKKKKKKKSSVFNCLLRISRVGRARQTIGTRRGIKRERDISAPWRLSLDGLRRVISKDAIHNSQRASRIDWRSVGNISQISSRVNARLSPELSGTGGVTRRRASSSAKETETRGASRDAALVKTLAALPPALSYRYLADCGGRERASTAKSRRRRRRACARASFPLTQFAGPFTV